MPIVADDANPPYVVYTPADLDFADRCSALGVDPDECRQIKVTAGAGTEAFVVHADGSEEVVVG